MRSQNFDSSFLLYIFAQEISKLISMFKIIACINKKRAIGKDGKLLYSIKNDLANFKNMTVGNVVIMGRKTFESLPNGKPLPGRVNIVLTHDTEWKVKPTHHLLILNSIEDVKDVCETYFSDKEWFVIGGETIYNQFLMGDFVDEMRLTIVDDDTDGDTHFPVFNDKHWKTYHESLVQVDSSGGKETSFVFKILKKINE